LICHDGCTSGEYIFNTTRLTTVDPIAPPTLTPLDDAAREIFMAGLYSINLTAAAPPPSRRVTYPLVGFLFRILDNESGNITLIWQV